MNNDKFPKFHPLSFRHRIRDGATHYIDTEHFMGIDPLDHSKFHDIYRPAKNAEKAAIKEL